MRSKSRVEQYISLEILSGILLLIGVGLALCVSNTHLNDEYRDLVSLPISISIGDFSLNKPLIKWVNDGLMALFFLLLTLEAKFHLLEGEFTNKKAFLLPLMAAIGGAIVPGCAYYLLVYQTPEYLDGWAIPIATDTAFVLGALSFFSNKVPTAARLFVVALSIIDDIIAIVILALFYTSSLQFIPLLIAVICLLLLAFINSMRVGRLSFYLIIGAVLWIALVEAGIHGTIAGVLLGIFIPLRATLEENNVYSPLKRLEHFLHPVVALMILPLFAFLNSEISFKDLAVSDFYSSITLGIITGLFIGKQLGIILFSYVFIKFGICKLPRGISWRIYYGISLLCGIGFTFSLFIGLLSFEEADQINQMKLGVMVGSILSALAGVMIIRGAPNLPHVPLNKT